MNKSKVMLLETQHIDKPTLKPRACKRAQSQTIIFPKDTLTASTNALAASV